MLTKLLSTDQDELLKEERKVLARLKGALVRFNAAAEHQSALDRSIEQLDELFLLVIVGEFNSGKSAFINALVGASVAQEGVTPTTAQINVLQYGETASRDGQRFEPARDHGSRTHPARHSYRRYPRHQCDHQGTRSDHGGVRAPLGPRAVCHLGRPSVYRDRARVSRAGARLGQEGRDRHQQDRHPHSAPGGRGPRLCRRQRARPARLQPRDLSGQRAPGA